MPKPFCGGNQAPLFTRYPLNLRPVLGIQGQNMGSSSLGVPCPNHTFQLHVTLIHEVRIISFAMTTGRVPGMLPTCAPFKLVEGVPVHKLVCNALRLARHPSSPSIRFPRCYSCLSARGQELRDAAADPGVILSVEKRSPFVDRQLSARSGGNSVQNWALLKKNLRQCSWHLQDAPTIH